VLYFAHIQTAYRWRHLHLHGEGLERICDAVHSLDQLILGGAEQGSTRTIARWRDDSFAHKTGRHRKNAETNERRPPPILMEVHARSTSARPAHSAVADSNDRQQFLIEIRWKLSS